MKKLKPMLSVKTVRELATMSEDLALANMSNAELRSAQKALRLTIEELAAHLGVSKRSLAGYRTDRRVPRAVALAVRFLVERRGASASNGLRAPTAPPPPPDSSA